MIRAGLLIIAFFVLLLTELAIGSALGWPATLIPITAAVGMLLSLRLRPVEGAIWLVSYGVVVEVLSHTLTGAAVILGLLSIVYSLLSTQFISHKSNRAIAVAGALGWMLYSALTASIQQSAQVTILVTTIISGILAGSTMFFFAVLHQRIASRRLRIRPRYETS